MIRNLRLEIELSQSHRRDEKLIKINEIIKKSKHKKHPTIAKIDSHVDENGQLVVDCPDLWAGNSSVFSNILQVLLTCIDRSEILTQNLDFELQDISKCLLFCWCCWYHYWLW